MNLFSRFKRTTPSADRASDIYSRLLKDRIVFIGTPIDDQIANLIVGHLLFLEAEDSTLDISLYVNSPGGSITASMAIFDTIDMIRPNVTTVCIGQAVGMAALIVARGTRGMRFAVPNARSQFVASRLAGVCDYAPAQVAEVERLDTVCVEAFGKCLHRSRRQIRDAFARELGLSSQEAIEFGLIDGLVAVRSSIPDGASN